MDKDSEAASPSALVHMPQVHHQLLLLQPCHCTVSQLLYILLAVPTGMQVDPGTCAQTAGL